MTTQTTVPKTNEKSAEVTTPATGSKVTPEATLENNEPKNQRGTESAAINKQKTDTPASKPKPVTKIQTEKSKAKKTQNKNATIKRKEVVKEKKVRLASSCYHYYRHFLKDFLRPLAPSLRFQKLPDSYDGHLTIVESEKAKGLKALEKWNKENPGTKELFWDIKK